MERIDDWKGFGQRLTGSGTTRLTDVERYGQPASAPPNPADPAHPLLTAASPVRDAAGGGPAHSKDYRDFAQRLALLQATSPEALIATLRDA